VASGSADGALAAAPAASARSERQGSGSAGGAGAKQACAGTGGPLATARVSPGRWHVPDPRHDNGPADMRLD